MRSEAHCKSSYFPRIQQLSMRNLNEDSTSHNIMPLFYSSKAVINGQYRNDFVPGSETSCSPGHGKDEVKQKILQHEAVFKNQVCELHRLYGIQKGIMDCEGPSCSSSVQGSEVAKKQHVGSLIMTPNYGHNRTCNLGVEVVGSCVDHCKGQKKLSDLQRPPPDDFIDVEGGERKLSKYGQNGNIITDSQGSKRGSKGFYDLNEPFETHEEAAIASSSNVNGGTDVTLYASDGARKNSHTARKAGLNQNIPYCPITQDYSYINKDPLFSQSSKCELDDFHHGPRRDPTVITTGSFYTDRDCHGLKSTDRNHDIPNNNHSGQINSWLFGSLAHSVLPWLKPPSDSCPKMNPFENSSRQQWQPSMWSQEQLGVKRQVNSFGFSNGSPRADINSGVINSNVSSGKAVVLLQDLNVAAENDELEDHLHRENEAVIDLNQPGSSDPCGISGTRILGVPIYDREIKKERRKNRMIDLNRACEPDELTFPEERITERKRQKKARGYIDLNSCVDDFENPPKPHEAKKAALVIDLEVPASMESDEAPIRSPERKNEQRFDETLRNAAKIMIEMSSLSPRSHVTDATTSSHRDPLRWFSDIVFSNEGEKMLLEIDEFEAMTLQLQETKGEEDYKNSNYILEITDEEEGKLRSRPRARRGRQRKNFQRDVLPGMTSLTRHEVNEDLQAFGGIMRATGHPWHGGGSRVRRRAAYVSGVRDDVSTRSTPRVGDEDSRSLTGWGKTTRRPRRQRCGPTGNHQMYVWS